MTQKTSLQKLTHLGIPLPIKATPSFLNTISLKTALWISMMASSILLITASVLLSLGITAGSYMLLGAGLCTSLFALGAMFKSIKENLFINNTQRPLAKWTFAAVETIIFDLYQQCTTTITQLSTSDQLTSSFHKMEKQYHHAQYIEYALQKELNDVEMIHKKLSLLNKKPACIEELAIQSTAHKQEQKKIHQNFLETLKIKLKENQNLSAKEKKELEEDIEACQCSLDTISVDLSVWPALLNEHQPFFNELLMRTLPKIWQPLLDHKDPTFLNKVNHLCQKKICVLSSAKKRLTDFINELQKNLFEAQQSQQSLQKEIERLDETIKILVDLDFNKESIDYQQIENFRHNISSVILFAEKKYKEIHSQSSSYEKLQIENITNSLHELFLDNQQSDLIPLITPYHKDIDLESKTSLTKYQCILTPPYTLPSDFLHAPNLITIKKKKIFLLLLYTSICFGKFLAITGSILFSLGISAGIGVLVAASILTVVSGIVLLLKMIKKSLPSFLSITKKEKILQKESQNLYLSCQTRLTVQDSMQNNLSSYQQQAHNELLEGTRIKDLLEQALCSQKKKELQLSNMLLLQRELKIRTDIANTIIQQTTAKKMFFTNEEKDSIASSTQAIKSLSSVQKALNGNDKDVLTILDVAWPTVSKETQVNKDDLSTEINCINAHIHNLEKCLDIITVWLTTHKSFARQIIDIISQIQQHKINFSYSQETLDRFLSKKTTPLSTKEIHYRESLIKSIKEQITSYDISAIEIKKTIKTVSENTKSLQILKEELCSTLSKDTIRSLKLDHLLKLESKTGSDSACLMNKLNLFPINFPIPDTPLTDNLFSHDSPEYTQQL